MERKEAIEVIKKNWPDSSFTMLREALETLIPELKESEENRIKSDIQYAVRCAYGDKSEQTNKILGWIEKQVPACLSHDDEIMIRQLTEYFKTGKGLQNTNDTVVEWLTDVKRKLEKQGDKDKLIQELGEYKVKYTQEVLEKHLKTINKDDERLRKTTIAFLKDFAEQGYENAVECIDWLEKHEQKHETPIPRFNIGDWVIVHNKDAYQVIGVNTYDYRLQHYLGGKMNYPFKYESDLKPWTIQDAKDGDVLFIGIDGSTCIFEKLEGNLLYSHIISDGKLFVENSHYYYEISDDVYPATKEQRDQLEKAMNDEGYTFDFEKKELRKIEQKYTPKHKVGDTIYYKSFGEVKSMIVDNVVTDSTDNPMYEDKEGNAVFEKALIEQKPSWSEEDEEIINNIGEYLNCYGNYIADKNEEKAAKIYKSADWLKFLKYRVQPKQEWSEKDASLCTQIQGILSVCRCYNLLSPDLYKEMCDWLKSLRPQSTWKPSEEQMVAINTAINVLGKGTLNGKQLVELQEQLLELRGSKV